MSDKIVNRRSRNWLFVVYPESLPHNYQDIIINLHTNFIMSPLHDKDVNPTGEVKKAHYHCLLSFESDKSFTQVSEITSSLNGTIPQICQNVKGAVRYFIHFDNPEKAPYNKEDIKVFGYADLEEYFKVSFTEKYRLMREIIEFIDSNDIDEFSDFVTYCMNNHFNDWFPMCCDSNCNLIINFIKSKRYKLQRQKAVEQPLGVL